MRNWTIELPLAGQTISLHVQAPSDVPPIEDYREATFELPGRGKHRAVFFVLPDKKSNNPYAVKPKSEWTVPVRWDDNTMLFVPSLDDSSIVAAMNYILAHGLEGAAFENEDDIELDDSNR